jgi:hypothetical protein
MFGRHIGLGKDGGILFGHGTSIAEISDWLNPVPIRHEHAPARLKSWLQGDEYGRVRVLCRPLPSSTAKPGNRFKKRLAVLVSVLRTSFLSVILSPDSTGTI